MFKINMTMDTMDVQQKQSDKLVKWTQIHQVYLCKMFWNLEVFFKSKSPTSAILNYI